MSARLSPVRPANGTCTTLIYRRRLTERAVLYQLVQKNLETWLAARREADPDGVPIARHVERELRGYLECGILAFGFARAYCDTCGHDFLVAFSCKGRGLCPSCTTRRMAETAAHLVEHVFPQVPVRQWVVTFPRRLRFFLHRDPVLLGRVRRSVLRTIESGLRRRCSDAPRVARSRVLRIAARQGALTPEVAADLARWGHGGGFSLHAAVLIEAADRSGLERLLRYCARPAFASERLSWDGSDQSVQYHLTKPLPTGQTELALTPLERLKGSAPPPSRSISPRRGTPSRPRPIPVTASIRS